MGKNKTIGLTKKTERVIARMREIQKLKHRSQLISCDNNLGALITNQSLNPILLITRIIKAEPNVIPANIIKYIVDIILWLLM